MLSFSCRNSIESKTILFGLGILIVLLLPIIVDSKNQELHWGFSSGERFYFKETQITGDYNITGTPLILNYYVEVKDNYTILDPLTYFPFANEETFFHNDTLLLRGGFEFAVPIGNWDLLNDTYYSVYSSTYDTIDIIDEDDYWSIQTTRNRTYIEYNETSIFSKTDGVLVYYLLIVDFDIDYWINIQIERVNPPFSLNTPIVIAGGVIVFDVLLVSYFSWKLRYAE